METRTFVKTFAMLEAFVKDAQESFSLNSGSKELQRLYQEQLQAWGISNFYWVKITRSGRLTFLTNNVSCALDYWEEGLPVRTGFEHVAPAVQSYALPFEDLLEQDVTRFFAEQGCYDGLGFVNRYYDTVQFASFLRSRPSEHPKDRHLQQHEFACWLRSFEWSCRGLLKHAEKHAIQLPEAYFAPELDAFYSTRSVEVPHQGLTAKLSFRELDCLHLCGRGFSRPQIASLLGMSARTVETHLDSLRNRLGLEGRDDLICFAYTSALVQNYRPRFS